MFLKSNIYKFPYLYILLKSPNFKIAKLNFKAYNLIKNNNLFDEEFYLLENNNLNDFEKNPLIHYMFFGFKEGKDPSPNFDDAFYLNEYDDANKSDLSPLAHYALYGLKNNRKTKIYENKIPFKSQNEIDEILKDSSYSLPNTNNKKKILYVLHEKISQLGGTGFINQDIISQMNEEYDCYFLSSNNNLVDLWFYSNKKLEKIANWKVNIKKPSIIHDYNKKSHNNDLKNYFFSKELRDIYFNIIYNLKIDLIHINHLINHSFDLLEISKFFNVPYILNIHDFYYFCPSIHLLNNKDSYCEVKCLNCDFSCNIDKNTEKIVTLWRKYSIKAINNSNLAIFPSNYALNFYKDNFKDINKDKLVLISPGRDFKNKYNSYSVPNKKPIKILFPGYISPHKGSLLIKDVKKLDKDEKFEFHFLGTTTPLLNKYGIDHGRYNRDDFAEKVNQIKPSFIGLFSICPETYSHTLTESWNSNLLVIATNLGAFKERINETGGGWLVDYKSPKKIYDEITKISNNQENYLEKVQNINKITFKSRKEMFEDYKKIYNDLIND